MSSAISWNPGRELKAVLPGLHRGLSGALARTGENRSRALWTSVVNVHETDQEYDVKVDRGHFAAKVPTRVLGTGVALLIWASVAAAQAPGAKPAAPTPAAKPAVSAAASPPVGTLLQVMRGILFHSSNLIFATQGEDPADPKKPLDASFGTYAKVYSGWPVVENAAVTLAESADLLLKPGRLYSNGRPVPLDRADYRKFVQGLRAAGQAALKAAQSKNVDNMIEVSGTVSEACENCHSVYRDKPDLKSRCLP